LEIAKNISVTVLKAFISRWCHSGPALSRYRTFGLKPMQPMQLHWAPRLWVPRVMVFGKIIHFAR